MTTNESKKIAMRVSWVSIVVNIVLSVFKLIAGIIANSGAMVSDAIHSASDVFSTFVVMMGVNISSKKDDNCHQYGHERMECIAAIILSVILFITGFGIGIDGINKIKTGTTAPGALALVAAVVSIATKEWMFWYTRAAAKKTKSGALMADAWHHRSDALSSVGSFIGIGGAILGFPILDPIASLVICLLIFKASYDITMDAIHKLVDKSCDEETMNQLTEIILAQAGVIALDLLKTRMFASKFYVDVEIKADGNLSLTQAHEIAENVHSAIEKNFEDAKHCMVHVNPSK